ncbi:MAG: hypothetical protein KAI39_08765, partial [Desulfobulbaceae bacterium]|nr:hypothetical protein [Desulfobulbaceae bacterium]
MSTEEFVGVLGLGGTKDVQDLITPLFDALLHDVTESLDRPDLRAVVPSYQIQDLQLSPEFLRGGDPVNCQLEVNFLDKVPLRIALKTGAREFALIPGPSPGIYQGTVISEQANGPHDVSLVIDWGDKEEPETISDLASYVVVNSPPPLDVTLHKGIEVAGVTFFRNHLVIIPELSRPHLMDRWTVEVKDEKNLTVMTEEHMGNLPSRMVWNGKNKFRRQMKDGLYTFIIKAWDRAGNEVEKAFPVVLQTEPTSLDFQVFYEYNKKFLNVRQVEANAAPVIDWELRVSNSKGKEILQMGGDSFPAVIEIPENFKEGIILCDFNTRDSLGNYLKLKNTKVEIPKDGLYSEDPTFSSINEDGWVDSF